MKESDKSYHLNYHILMKNKIFMTRRIPSIAQKLLEDNKIEVEIWEGRLPPSAEELKEASKGVQGLLTMLSDDINSELLESATELKVISQYAVGFNNIDTNTANLKNIKVSNTPDVLTDATAELAMALMLGVSRNILNSNTSIREGDWKTWEPKGHLGVSLKGKTLGIFGMGRIGECFARKCHHAFDMKIIYVSRTEKTLSFPATKVNLDELLSMSNVVSLHSPLTNETKNLFNSENISKMIPNSIFINTSRGELHNEEDLLTALEENHLFGIGLDVTNPEPMEATSPLLRHPKVIVTPHIGSATFEARDAMAELCAKNIILALDDKELITPVN